MWETINTTSKTEWNITSDMWLKRYSKIQILTLLRIISLNIMTKNLPHKIVVK